MRPNDFRDGQVFESDAYAGGGLLGLLKQVMQQQTRPRQGDLVGLAPAYGDDSLGGSHDGTPVGRRMLGAEPDQYQTIPEGGERALSLPRDQNFRQLWRLSNGTPQQTPEAPASRAAPSAWSPLSEADQALQAREVAAARTARGVRSAARANAPAPDPVDIAKSAGIGAVNGTISIAGLPGDVLTGFGHFPKNAIPNMWRRSNDLPPLPDDAPDYFKSWGADAWRRSLEDHVGELYQPKTTAGRYAETIGEMVPALVGGEALVAARNLAKAGAVLRQLPATLSKHAVLPGTAVQAVEDADPESPAGRVLQKGWPWLRRGLPFALAIRRNSGR